MGSIPSPGRKGIQGPACHAMRNRVVYIIWLKGIKEIGWGSGGIEHRTAVLRQKPFNLFDVFTMCMSDFEKLEITL